MPVWLKLLITMLYWPLALLACTTPIWAMVALRAVDLVWVAIMAMVLLAIVVLSGWSYVRDSLASH